MDAIFTFHYASTLSTVFAAFFAFSSSYLHSTMLLLYLYGDIVSTEWDKIYIPLCFYFIASGEDVHTERSGIYIPLCFYFIANISDENFGASSFTFHYASTLSCYRNRRPTGRAIIYIPLCFYFIRPHPQGWEWIDLIYIPLCFYFIQKACKEIISQADLHSTMLLLYPFSEVYAGASASFTFHYASTLS